MPLIYDLYHSIPTAWRNVDHTKFVFAACISLVYLTLTATFIIPLSLSMNQYVLITSRDFLKPENLICYPFGNSTSIYFYTLLPPFFSSKMRKALLVLLSLGAPSVARACLYTATQCQCSISSSPGKCGRYQSGSDDSATCFVDDCQAGYYNCDCFGDSLCNIAPCAA